MSIATREPDLVGIDPNRSALLQRMLAKDPARRPTARQVLDRVRGNTTGGTTLTDMPLRPRSQLRSHASAPPHSRCAPAADPPATPPTPPSAGPQRVAAPARRRGPARTRRSSRRRCRQRRAPPPVRPRTAGNPRTVGPRTAAAQQRRATRRRVLVGRPRRPGAAGRRLVRASRPSGGDSGTGAPGPAAPRAHRPRLPTPRRPGQGPVRDGDWLLATYRLDNTADGLVVSGTVRNTGSATASADLTTWVYLGGESLGSVATTVTDVPAGETVPVTMTGDAVWKKGQKVVLLQAS